MKKDRRPLTQVEIDECLALKKEIAAFNERRPKGERLTQEGIAHELGMSQGTFSSHLNGARAINKEMAAKLASLLEITVEKFSPRLADEIRGLAGSIAEQSAAAVPETRSPAAQVLAMLKGKNLSAEQLSSIERAVAETVDGATPAPIPDNVITADFSRRPLVGDEIRIAHYDVQGAMGNGKLVHDFPEMFRDVTVSQQHLRELGVTYKDPAHLKLITGDGQSMQPTIQDKDPLIADASIREFAGDGIYAFVWQGFFYIKRLQVADAEHFEMISDNPNHKDRLIRIDETYIQARILLVWNAKRV